MWYIHLLLQLQLAHRKLDESVLLWLVVSKLLLDFFNLLAIYLQALDRMELPQRSVALLPENEGKSRYKELYPGKMSTKSTPAVDIINKLTQ